MYTSVFISRVQGIAQYANKKLGTVSSDGYVREPIQCAPVVDSADHSPRKRSSVDWNRFPMVDTENERRP